MRFEATVPQVHKHVEHARGRFRRESLRAARIATDRAAREAQQHIRRRMHAVGLGKLGNAVGQTSALKKKQLDRTYGVIYAKGHTADDDRGAAALEAYSQGVTIRANRTTWLAFQTNAIPRRAGRKRMTPRLYQTQGLQAALGPLEFRPIRKDLALLVIKKVTVSPKTGRAKRDLGRKTRTRIPKKEVVAFILIKVTRRAQRFDKDLIVAIYHRKVPDYMREAIQAMRASASAPPLSAKAPIG